MNKIEIKLNSVSSLTLAQGKSDQGRNELVMEMNLCDSSETESIFVAPAKQTSVCLSVCPSVRLFVRPVTLLVCI